MNLSEIRKLYDSHHVVDVPKIKFAAQKKGYFYMKCKNRRLGRQTVNKPEDMHHGKTSFDDFKIQEPALAKKVLQWKMLCTMQEAVKLQP